MIGTGFVNIDQYLGANQNAGKDLQKAFSGQLNSGQTGMMSDFSSKWDPVAKQFANSPIAMSGDQWKKALVNGQGDVSGLQKNVSWNDVSQIGGPNFSGDAWQKAKGLTSSDTAGTTMAQLQNPNAMGAYTPQLMAIDRAIYGQGAGAQQVAQNGKDLSRAQDYGSFLYGSANNRIASGNAKNDAAVSGNVSALRGIASGIIDPAAQKAAAANTTNDQNKVNSPGAGYTWLEPSASLGPATASDFITGQQGYQLSGISQLLGDPSLNQPAMAGSWHPGQWVAPPPQGGKNKTIPNQNYAPLPGGGYTAGGTGGVTKDIRPPQKGYGS